MTDRYAIIGNPVAHSKSPEIHAAFARQTGQDISYERILTPLGQFKETVDEFRRQGGRGASVTVPFKVEAYRYSEQRSLRAANCGAVNFMKWESGGNVGDNTDGAGLVRDIESNLGVSIAGKRVLIVGAGGAARGAVSDLFGAQPAVLAIANRTESRAVEVAEALSAVGKMQVLSLAELPKHHFDIVINATSASLSNDLPPVPVSCFAADSLAYDMMYGKGLTPFLALAANAGAKTADGLGMLIEQAAEAFQLWRGVRPDTAPVFAMLRRT